MNLFTLDNLFLLLTGLVCIFLLLRFYGRWSKEKGIHDIYYMIGFLVLLVSGLLLIFLGLDILSSPYVLTVASLIPLGISIGLMEQFFPEYKKLYKWFALVGFLAIAYSAIAGTFEGYWYGDSEFSGVAGLIIFLGPFLAKKAPAGFWWVGIGGVLIGLGGIALAFISMGSQLLFFSPEFVMSILTPLLLLMSLAFAYGFTKDL